MQWVACFETFWIVPPELNCRVKMWNGKWCLDVYNWCLTHIEVQLWCVDGLWVKSLQKNMRDQSWSEFNQMEFWFWLEFKWEFSWFSKFQRNRSKISRVDTEIFGVWSDTNSLCKAQSMGIMIKVRFMKMEVWSFFQKWHETLDNPLTTYVMHQRFV